MWDKISFTKKIDANTSDIKELRDSLRELTSATISLSNSNNEIKFLFEQLKKDNEDEKEHLLKEWQLFQDKNKQDQEAVLLKLKNLLREE
jgi:hypothetical protein